MRKALANENALTVAVLEGRHEFMRPFTVIKVL
jgi:hypothetical protein